MKKPDITKGEWIISGTNTEDDADFPTTYIDVHDHFKKIHVHGFDGEAYAKAIICVPEMIDALIEAKETIRTWHGEVAWDLYQHSPEMKKINNALQKAGVTDL